VRQAARSATSCGCVPASEHATIFLQTSQGIPVSEHTVIFLQASQDFPASKPAGLFLQASQGSPASKACKFLQAEQACFWWLGSCLQTRSRHAAMHLHTARHICCADCYLHYRHSSAAICLCRCCACVFMLQPQRLLLCPPLLAAVACDL
jgi:hypothetical protein